MKGEQELVALVNDLLEGNDKHAKNLLDELLKLVLEESGLKAEGVDTISIMKEYIMFRLQNSKNALKDFGLYGKAFEIAIRCYIMNRTSRHGMTVKGQGKTDIKFSYQDKRYTCEIKTACGNITDAHKSQYIIYCMNVDPSFPAEQQGYVFTREQWLDFLANYDGRGSLTKVASDGLHIQSFYVNENIRPTASKAITRYIERTLFDLPTVEEFFAER